MAYELVAEMLDHSPPELTSGEMLVLVALAEWANFETRECWRRPGELQTRARVSASGLRAVFRRLAERGLDPRVVAAHNADGSPRYAWKGHASVFRVPRMPAPADCSCPLCRHHSGAFTERKAATAVSQSRHSGDSQSVKNRKNHRPRDAVAANVALQARCPYCEAPPGSPCVDPGARDWTKVGFLHSRRGHATAVGA
jgi:hypothetical protein